MTLKLGERRRIGENQYVSTYKKTRLIRVFLFACEKEMLGADVIGDDITT